MKTYRLEYFDVNHDADLTFVSGVIKESSDPEETVFANAKITVIVKGQAEAQAWEMLKKSWIKATPGSGHEPLPHAVTITVDDDGYITNIEKT